MKKIKFLVVIFFICFFCKETKASDLSLAKSWAKTHYKEPIKVVTANHVPHNRKGTVYIEILKTKSRGGRRGKTISGNFDVKYPKKVAKNKKITMYLIWNPKNNIHDDVQVICMGILK